MEDGKTGLLSASALILSASGIADTFYYGRTGTFECRLLKPAEEYKPAGSLRKYEQMKQPAFRSTLLVFINEKIIPVKITDIAFIHSAGGLVKVYAKDGRRYLISEVLDELEPQVNPYLFFRASRQFLINRDVIVMAEHFFNRRLVVKLSMETPERIIVSKMKAPELVAWMQR